MPRKKTIAKVKQKKRKLTNKLTTKKKSKPTAKQKKNKSSKFTILTEYVFAKHDPQKVKSVTKLMNKYKGREKDVFVKVCKTYKEKPKAIEEEYKKSKLKPQSNSENQKKQILTTPIDEEKIINKQIINTEAINPKPKAICTSKPIAIEKQKKTKKLSNFQNISSSNPPSQNIIPNSMNSTQIKQNEEEEQDEDDYEDDFDSSYSENFDEENHNKSKNTTMSDEHDYESPLIKSNITQINEVDKKLIKKMKSFVRWSSNYYHIFRLEELTRKQLFDSKLGGAIKHKSCQIRTKKDQTIQTITPKSCSIACQFDPSDLKTTYRGNTQSLELFLENKSQLIESLLNKSNNLKKNQNVQNYKLNPNFGNICAIDVIEPGYNLITIHTKNQFFHQKTIIAIWDHNLKMIKRCFMTSSNVTCVCSGVNDMVIGSTSGILELFDLTNTSSKLLKKGEYTFHVSFPSFTTISLARAHTESISDIKFETSKNVQNFKVFSLDESGVLCIWHILHLKKNNSRINFDQKHEIQMLQIKKIEFDKCTCFDCFENIFLKGNCYISSLEEYGRNFYPKLPNKNAICNIIQVNKFCCEYVLALFSRRIISLFNTQHSKPLLEFTLNENIIQICWSNKFCFVGLTEKHILMWDLEEKMTNHNLKIKLNHANPIGLCATHKADMMEIIVVFIDGSVSRHHHKTKTCLKNLNELFTYQLGSGKN